MVSFVNFSRIASICVGFHLSTLKGYFFSLRLLAKFEFPLEYQIKLVLKTKMTEYGITSFLSYLGQDVLVYITTSLPLKCGVEFQRNSLP